MYIYKKINKYHTNTQMLSWKAVSCDTVTLPCKEGKTASSSPALLFLTH